MLPSHTDILQADQRKSLNGCSIEPDPNEFEAKTEEGLVRGHAYSITKVNLFPQKLL